MRNRYGRVNGRTRRSAGKSRDAPGASDGRESRGRIIERFYPRFPGWPCLMNSVAADFTTEKDSLAEGVGVGFEPLVRWWRRRSRIRQDCLASQLPAVGEAAPTRAAGVLSASSDIRLPFPSALRKLTAS